MLESGRATAGEIFGNGKVYRVPPFQRDYSWEEESWEDLWLDLIEAKNSDQTHYMGAIVLQGGEDRFTVIDGQQRLATISILALAVIQYLRQLADRGVEPEANRERADLLFAQFVGSKDAASLRYVSRLELNRSDNGFFQQTLVELQTPVNARKLNASEMRLWGAFQYFSQRLEEHFGEASSGSAAAELIGVVSRRFVFIRIHVEDELSAYTVFETLNARGIELTAPDLLKNHLFALVARSDTDLTQVRGQWDRIVSIVPATELHAFLRHFLNSSQTFVRSERLFKELRELVNERSKVFGFLRSLEAAAHLYAALGDPEDDFWKDYPDAIPFVRALVLFGVSQYRPLALACHSSGWASDDFARALKLCAVVSFRFNVVAQRNTQTLERAYNAAAMEVISGKATKPRQVFGLLKGVYLDDEDFARDFAGFSLSAGKKKLAHSILSAIEGHLSGSDPFGTVALGTIEHILPENPSSGWDFSDEQRTRYLWAIGNLTLLESRKNREAGGKSPSAKQEIYRSSQFSLTRDLEVEDWSPGAIVDRQERLAKVATQIWRSDFA